MDRRYIRGNILPCGPLVLVPSSFAVNSDAVRRSYATTFRFSQNVAVLDVPRIGRVLVDAGFSDMQELVD